MSLRTMRAVWPATVLLLASMAVAAASTAVAATAIDASSAGPRASVLAAPSRTPSETQQAYMRHEQIMFVHFSICTYADCEQDTACRNKTNRAEVFDPTNVNVTQWIEAAAALGATHICLTARHTGGFAL